MLLIVLVIAVLVILMFLQPNKEGFVSAPYSDYHFRYRPVYRNTYYDYYSPYDCMQNAFGKIVCFPFTKTWWGSFW